MDIFGVVYKNCLHDFGNFVYYHHSIIFEWLHVYLDMTVLVKEKPKALNRNTVYKRTYF